MFIISCLNSNTKINFGGQTFFYKRFNYTFLWSLVKTQAMANCFVIKISYNF